MSLPITVGRRHFETIRRWHRDLQFLRGPSVFRAVGSLTSVWERCVSQSVTSNALNSRIDDHRLAPCSWEKIYTTAPIDKEEDTFGKILIANRGEIACRIIRTAKKMGIKTVAIHSVADAFSPFVKMADEAVNIGPAAASESYLVFEKILKVVKDTGAEAVHPGYGFLSENTHFVEELEKAGVVFIGPNSAAIRGMGDKLASKRLAMEAGVSCIPGFDGVIRNVDHCIELSKEIGYPVMIKASAGGGGKGMRIAHNDAEAKEAFKLCSEEGSAFFGDDRMLVEKFVDQPRHVEVQVLGDKHGNVIHLNERECSIQRRNQKVIEEAPSTYLDDAIRSAMGAQAVSLAKAISYDSAGTVEFLMDSQKKFYFLEMNTRLQVEHPITECITGVDLVHQMIRSARGHKLSLQQSDIGIRGWAIESRVYAEDPLKKFGTPSIGRLHRYEEPDKWVDGIRCDSGIEEGSEISMYYDPMICKLTSYGDTRDEAIKKAVNALDHYVIRGVSHNIALLRDVLMEPNFLAGKFTTNYLPETYPDGFKGTYLSETEIFRLAAVVAIMHCKDQARLQVAINDNPGVIPQPKKVEMVLTIKGEYIKAIVEPNEGGSFRVHVLLGDKDGETRELNVTDDFNLADPVIIGRVEDDKETANLVVQLIKRWNNGSLRVRYKGSPLDVEILPGSAASLRRFMKAKPVLDLSRVVVSPMPGIIKSVSVAKGQVVGEGLEVCIVEAMKMQNSLKAAMTGKVKAVNVKVGDTVEEDQVLVEFESEE